MDTKTLCLATLSLGDATGYEIKKMFEEGSFSHFYDAGFGSIYPALNKMLSEELVNCQYVDQAGRPDKKVYSLTEKGRERLIQELHKAPAFDKIRSECVVMMFFAHLLSDSQTERVFDTYVNQYKQGIQCLQELDLSEAAHGRRFVHGLGLKLYETIVEYMEQHREQLLNPLPDQAPPGAVADDEENLPGDAA